MPSTYSGNAANVDLTVGVSISEPIGSDPRNAASVDTALEKLADYAEGLREVTAIQEAFTRPTLNANFAEDGVDVGNQSPGGGLRFFLGVRDARCLLLAGTIKCVTAIAAGGTIATGLPVWNDGDITYVPNLIRAIKDTSNQFNVSPTLFLCSIDSGGNLVSRAALAVGDYLCFDGSASLSFAGP